MLRRNSEHGGAEATGVVKRDDLLALRGELLAHSIDQMDFRAYGEARASRRLANDFEQTLGGTNRVRLLADFEPAFGMNDDLDAGIFCSNVVDVLGQKALVNRAVSLPQNDFRCAQALRSEATVDEIRIPDHHFVERNAEGMSGVAAQMLIGKKKRLRTSRQTPL